MREFLDFLTGSTAFFGYQVPTIMLVAAGLVALSAIMRSIWPIFAAALLLFVIYGMPHP